MKDVKQGIAMLLAMMTVLKFAPGVDDGTVTTYVWVLSKKDITPEEVEQITTRVMTTKREWQTPAELVEVLSSVRRDAMRPITSGTLGLERGAQDDSLLSREFRDSVIGNHAADIREEIERSRSVHGKED